MHAAYSLAKQAAGLVNDQEYLLAIERFTQSQAISPSPLALYGIGVCYLRLKDYSKVVKIALEALKDGSQFDDKVRVMLARAYEGLGEYFLAQSVWESLEKYAKEELWIGYSRSNQRRLSEILRNSEEFLKVFDKNRECTEIVYLVAKEWVDKWRKWVFEVGEHPGLIVNRGLIKEFVVDPRDYAAVILTEDLTEGQDFEIFNTPAYRLLKDQYGIDYELKRFSLITPHFTEIEIHLQTFPLLFCPKVSEIRSETFKFPFSQKETIQEIISACKSLIESSFDFVNFNFDIFRIWKLSAGSTFEQTAKIFLPTADLISVFPPKYSPGDTFLFEFQRSDGFWTIYSQLETPCPYCQTLAELSVLCPVCKTIKYCSPGCLDLHKFVHSVDCTQLIERNGKTGLRNLGNTCYMNAVLQCMSHTQPLRLYFLNKMYLTENPVNGRVTQSFARLIFQLWGPNSGMVFPSEFKKIFCQKFRQFEGISQQDSHEFLTHFLDGLDEELKSEEKSVVGRNFFGTVQNSIVCSKCLYVSEKEERFLSLGLPVVNLDKLQITLYFVFANSEKAVFRRVLGCYFSWSCQELLKTVELEFGCSFQLSYYDMLEYRGEVLGGDIGEYLGKVIVAHELSAGFKVVFSVLSPMGKLTFDRCFFLDFEDIPDLQQKLKKKVSDLFQIPENWEKFGSIKIFHNKELVHSLEGLNKNSLKAVVEVLDSNFKGYKHFVDLPGMNIEVPAGFDVYAGLRILMGGEVLDERNQWLCENCRMKNSAKKVMKVSQFPKVLVLHLMKFKSSLGKLDTFVEFPLEELDLEEFGCGSRYDLYAVVNHYGSYAFGHYTAYVKVDGEWFEMDDAFVNGMGVGRVVSSNAYLLFYMKK